jgi:PTH1 family peptidyl-tRNA hydrolase
MIVGLGNPGSKYERNRHNIGFRVVDELAGRHGFGALRSGKLGGDSASGMLSIGGARHKAILLKPMEFMNLSGYAVQRTAQFHDIEVEKIVVVHDEIDLDFGVVRLKKAGGHGGHNGLRSITEQLGSADFLRVRVGVGRSNPSPGTGSGAGPAKPVDGGDAAARPKAGPSSNVAGWVLSDFPSALAAQVDQLIRASADGAEAIVARGIGPAMNEQNGRPAVGAA